MLNATVVGQEYEDIPVHRWGGLVVMKHVYEQFRQMTEDFINKQ